MKLRTFSYHGDHATLIVAESVDRAQVLVRMISGPPATETEYSILLQREDWKTLQMFDAFDDAPADELPNMTQTLTFLEDEDTHGVSLEIRQAADRDVVTIVMRPDDSGCDFLITTLYRDEWNHLVSLDLITSEPEPRLGGSERRRVTEHRTDSTVH